MPIVRAADDQVPATPAMVRLAEIHDEHLETIEVMHELHAAFHSLVLLAKHAGVVPTITLRPRLPLAMGNYDAVIEIREHMALVRERDAEVAELHAQIEREQREAS